MEGGEYNVVMGMKGSAFPEHPRWAEITGYTCQGKEKKIENLALLFKEQ